MAIHRRPLLRHAPPAQPDPGFETFLPTVRLWLERAGDDEARALASAVRDEVRRRGLDPEAPAPERKA